ncbi:MAG: hypothetical protein ACHQNA_08600 [Acidimicrobiales bacterium]
MVAHRVVTIGAQLARALEAAHQLGVTHGAVGPDVVLVSEDDRAKLAGFTESGARSRLQGRTATPDGDVHDLADTLVDALLGGSAGRHRDAGRPISARALRAGVPRSLDDILVQAQAGGPLVDAGAFAAALSGLDIIDDAQPIVTREPTPPGGVPIPPPARTRNGRASVLAGTVIALVLVVGVAAAAFVLTSGSHNGHSGGPSTTAGGGGALTITAAHSFNPLSPDNPAKTENEQLVPKLIDGDPATVWSTSEYVSHNFGNLKTGTGVYLLLDGPHTLEQLTVTSTTHGWSGTVYVAGAPGTDLAAWGKPVATFTVNTDVTQVDLHGVKGSAVLIWITDLGPPLSHPDDPAHPYRVDIGEASLR